MEKWLRLATTKQYFEISGTPLWRQRGVFVFALFVFICDRKELEHFRDLGKKGDGEWNSEIGAAKIGLGSGAIAGEESVGGDVLRRPFFGEEEEEGVGRSAVLGVVGNAVGMVEAIGEVGDIGGVAV